MESSKERQPRSRSGSQDRSGKRSDNQGLGAAAASTWAAQRSDNQGLRAAAKAQKEPRLFKRHQGGVGSSVYSSQWWSALHSLPRWVPTPLPLQPNLHVSTSHHLLQGEKKRKKGERSPPRVTPRVKKRRVSYRPETAGRVVTIFWTRRAFEMCWGEILYRFNSSVLYIRRRASVECICELYYMYVCSTRLTDEFELKVGREGELSRAFAC